MSLPRNPRELELLRAQSRGLPDDVALLLASEDTGDGRSDQATNSDKSKPNSSDTADNNGINPLLLAELFGSNQVGPMESAQHVWQRLGRAIFPSSQSEGGERGARGGRDDTSTFAPQHLGLPRQEVLGAVAYACDKLGVPLDTALRISWIESRWVADAKNKYSSAAGLFQAIDSTAASLWAKLREKYGSTIPELNQPYNPYSAVDSALVGVEYAAENSHKLAPYSGKLEAFLGHDPQNASVYLSHFLGPGAAYSIAGEDLNMPIETALERVKGGGYAQSVMSANPNLAGLSVGGVIRWADKSMGRADVSEAVLVAQNSAGKYGNATPLPVDAALQVAPAPARPLFVPPPSLDSASSIRPGAAPALTHG